MNFIKKFFFYPASMLLSITSIYGTPMQAFAQNTTHIESVGEQYDEALKLIGETRYADAKSLLLQVIEKEPRHVGAWLDLAIVQCELGNKAEAHHLFDQLAQRFNPPPAILEVIALQKNRKCADPTAKTIDHIISMSLDRGYDSNVNQGASNSSFTLGSGASQVKLELLPEYLPKSDRFSTLSLFGNVKLPANGTTVFVNVNAKKYDQYSSFNTISAALGAEQSFEQKYWVTQITGFTSDLLLGDRLYQKQAGVQLHVTPTSKYMGLLQLGVTTGITIAHYPTVLNYDSKTSELRGKLFYENLKTQIFSSVGVLLDSGTSQRSGGNRAGIAANVNVRYKLHPQLDSELSWNRQVWNSSTPYSPGLIDKIRRQDTEVLRLALIKPLIKNQSLKVELRHVNNRENITILQYKNTSIQFGWGWQNF